MRNPRNDDGSVETGSKADAAPVPLPGNTPERTCILTRRKATKEELIRLALGPDGSVAPDVRARAPVGAEERVELDAGAAIHVARVEVLGAGV